MLIITLRRAVNISVQKYFIDHLIGQKHVMPDESSIFLFCFSILSPSVKKKKSEVHVEAIIFLNGLLFRLNTHICPFSQPFWCLGNISCSSLDFGVFCLLIGLIYGLPLCSVLSLQAWTMALHFNFRCSLRWDKSRALDLSAVFLIFFFLVWLCQQHPFKYFLQSILGGPGFLKPQRFSQEKAKKSP